MAVGQFTFYQSGKLNTFNGGISVNSDTIVAVLLTSNYTPDTAAHSTYVDVNGNEITDADYAPQVVSNFAFTNNSGTISLDSDNISFGTNVSIEAKYCVFVKRASTSLATSDLLLGYVDLDTTSTTSTVSSTNSDFAVNTPNGIYEAT